MTGASLLSLASLIILATGSIVVLLVGAFAGRNFVRPVALGTVLFAGISAVLVPTGGALPLQGVTNDRFGVFMAVMASLAAAVTLLVSKKDPNGFSVTEEHAATILFAASGAVALGHATSLLTMFLGLEAMTFGFYLLVAMDLEKSASVEAGLKYLLSGGVAAAFMAFGIGLLFMSSGTLDAVQIFQLARPAPLVMAGWGFLLTGLAFKLSLFPSHFWTPDVYRGAPASIGGYLAALSKTATVVFLLRLFGGADLAGNQAFLFPLMVIALLSMALGSIAGLRQCGMKQLLAYSSIAQMGYTAVALATGSPEGMRAALVHTVAYALSVLILFGVAAASEGVCEKEGAATWLKGLWHESPRTALVASIALLSLNGMPLTAGFIGKFYIIKSLAGAGMYWVAILVLFTALVSSGYYLCLILAMWQQPVSPEAPQKDGMAAVFVLGVLAFLLIGLGLHPLPFLELATAIIP